MAEKIPVYQGFYRPHAPVDHPGGGELITRQEFAEECDINNMIADFKQTGMFKHVNKHAERGIYANLPDVHDYQEALIQASRADAAFAALPSKIRQKWDNDPRKLLRALADPDQRQELEDMGILEKRELAEQSPPQAARAAQPAPQPASKPPEGPPSSDATKA